MNKLLEKAIETIRTLPDADQELAAEMLNIIAARRAEPYQLTGEERDAVLEGLAEADRGEFVSATRVDELLKRPWR